MVFDTSVCYNFGSVRDFNNGHFTVEQKLAPMDVSGIESVNVTVVG